MLSKKWGIRWIDVVMPPAVMGAVVAIIGLELAPVAVRQAGLAPWPTAIGQIVAPFVIVPNVVFCIDVHIKYRDCRQCDV